MENNCNTEISFWLDNDRLVNTIHLPFYATKPYEVGDTIQFKIDEIYPIFLERWSKKHTKQFIDTSISINERMREATIYKKFNVISIFKQITYSPNIDDIGHFPTFVYEYYLQIIK